MKRILVAVGTRPEIIKVAPIVHAARKDYKREFEVRLCFTGQHRSLGLQALGSFGLAADMDLQIMTHGQSLNEIASRMFERFPAVLRDVQPDILLVQGDTTTAVSAALCGFHMRVPVAHVEAGLRSHDLAAPFPEELNRQLISRCATYHFCPTTLAQENLAREGIDISSATVTGNTVVDALRMAAEMHDLSEVSGVHPALRSPYVLVTAHRRENFGPGIRNICAAIHHCAAAHPQVHFVLPVHENPEIKGPIHEELGRLANVLLVLPTSYIDLLKLLRNCLFVLTDSGGLQEEAPSFGKFCIVMRDRTERQESIDLGLSVLVGTSRDRIVAAVEQELRSPRRGSVEGNPYGDGKASGRILEALRRP